MGPRRTTLTYSSEDAAPVVEDKVYVYYCKYSGKHALTTDCNLGLAPRRKTDHALVIDTQKHTVKLYTSDGGAKFIKRSSGEVEKQYRLNVDGLPVGYRSEPEGRYLYILDDALTTYAADESGRGHHAPVPPCISWANKIPPKTQIVLDVEDRGKRPGVLKVTADAVRVQVTQSLNNTGGTDELLELLRNALGVRLGAMTLTRGESARHRLLLVDGLQPDKVFQRLKGSLMPVNRRRPRY